MDDQVAAFRRQRIVAVALSAVAGPGVGHLQLGRLPRGLVWMTLGPSVVLATATHAELVGERLGFDMVVPALVGFPIAIWLSAVVDLYVVARRPKAPLAVPFVGLAALLSLSIIVATAVSVDRYMLEAFRVPSSSMMPTLSIGDHIMIDKRSALERGDVVVFAFPEDPRQVYVKRVIGLPGDVVSFVGTMVFVNGALLPRCVLGKRTWIDEEMHEATVLLERAGGKLYLTEEERRPDAPVSKSSFQVAEGELFVMGDNRNNSNDSRFWYGGRGGGVPLALVKGRAIFRWMSTSGAETRSERVGTGLTEPILPRGIASLDTELARCRSQLSSGAPPSP